MILVADYATYRYIHYYMESQRRYATLRPQLLYVATFGAGAAMMLPLLHFHITPLR